MEKNKMSPDKI